MLYGKILNCLYCGQELINKAHRGELSPSTELEGGTIVFTSIGQGSEEKNNEAVFALCDKCMQSNKRITMLRSDYEKTIVRYYHELSEEEVRDLMDTSISILLLNRLYKPPQWCSMQNALDISGGCEKLMNAKTRSKISKETCGECKFFINN